MIHDKALWFAKNLSRRAFAVVDINDVASSAFILHSFHELIHTPELA